MTTSALALGLGVVPASAGTAPEPGGTAVRSAATGLTAAAGQPRMSIGGLAAGTHELTLITGDKLLLTGSGGGLFTVSVTSMAPRPAGRTAATIDVTSDGDTVHAIPEDVRSLVDDGRVDRRLFDLGYLAERKLTDAASKSLPLIVRYAAGNGFTAAEALPASDAVRSLRSVNGAAVSVPKATAGRFWSVQAGPARLATNVDRIWLDGTSKLSLDVSVPLIGAPQAWSAGLDGSGSKVAVLDSGADLEHPDLAGKIGASQSFVPGETVQDRHGHGTHVATTIAGSGAASGGKYKGVSPGAELLVGKVCGLTTCTDSAVIAGMEWAAAQGADVVSISLGGDPTDGTDPLSLAVDRLTASSGALFVIAAGNDGPNASTVSNPAAAASALAVAATSKADALASFSSRGPRIDGALKPDLAAPGVNIVAGRAAGTTMGSPVDASYTSASGTSMATPHVSGAAAILAQRHPDWKAGQLKAALMSTSKGVGLSVYEAGAGRVDIARAIARSVVATSANVDFGNLDPGQNPAPISKQVSYANTGDTPVTLTLTRRLGLIGGAPVPAGAFGGDDTVTVPANGTATATVTLDLNGLPTGRYSGAVIATDPAGTTLTTPVGLNRQPPRSELTVRLLDQYGQPPCWTCSTVYLTAVNVPDLASVRPRQISPGVFQVWVPQGVYSAHGAVATMDPATSRNGRAILLDPEIAVGGTTEVTLDVRQAEEVAMRTDRPSEPIGQVATYSRSRWDGQLLTSVTVGGLVWGQYRVLVTPTERVTTGRFDFGIARMQTNPQVTMRVAGPGGFDLQVFHRGYSDAGQRVDGDGGIWVPWPTRRGRVDLVDAGYARPEDLAGKELRGKLALMRWGDDRLGSDWGTPPDGIAESAIWADRVRNLANAGAIGYLAVSAPPAAWERHSSFSIPTGFVFPGPPGSPAGPELPEVQIPRDQGLKLVQLLAKGKVSVDLNSDPNVRTSYQLYPLHHQQVGGTQSQRISDRQLAVLDADYHGTTPAPFRTSVSVFTKGQGFGGGMALHDRGPVRRTDHYGPVSSKAMLMRSRQPDQASSWMSLASYPRAGRSSERWFAPVTAPGAIDLGSAYDVQDPNAKTAAYLCHMCREGNLLWPIMVSGSRDGTIFEGTMRIGGVKLYHADGTEIPAKSIADAYGLPAFELPAQDTAYKMVLQATGGSMDWTFRSAAPAEDNWMPGGPCVLHQVGGTDTCAQQPVLFLGYDLGPDLRLDNTVRAGGQHEFTVFAYHGRTPEAMPRIAGLKLSTSTDGGATWQPASVRRLADGRYSVRAVYPRLSSTNGSVAFKVQAWDAAGNTVSQTIDRAFTLSAR